MRKLNMEKRALLLNFLDMLSEKNWEMGTEIKALANIRYLEKMVEELRKNPQMTEIRFLELIKELRCDEC